MLIVVSVTDIYLTYIFVSLVVAAILGTFVQFVLVSLFETLLKVGCVFQLT